MEGGEKPREATDAEPSGRPRRYTALDLALDVLKAMDALEDVVCNHGGLPREISEKCVEVCRKLKENAIAYLETLKRLGRRAGGPWRTQRRGWRS